MRYLPWQSCTAAFSGDGGALPELPRHASGGVFGQADNRGQSFLRGVPRPAPLYEDEARGMKRIPLWLLPNVWSLDAPLVAVAWQALLAESTGTPLRLVARVILFLTVWLIYIADRLLDTRQPALEPEPERHQFYRVHRRAAYVTAAIILAVDAVLILLELLPAVFRTGLLTFAGVSLYFFILHGMSISFPKEAAVAILFTIGTFLVAFTRTNQPVLNLLPAAVSFCFLCLANLLAIEYGERATPMKSGLWYLVWVLALALICPIAFPGRWSYAIAMSAASLALIHSLGSRVGLAARRVLVDAVLLVPPLLLL